MTIEGITLEFMKQKNNNGTNNDNTYRTYSEILKRVKRNSGSWFDKKIDKISRKDVEDFLNYEREKGYAQNTLRKDYQLLKQAFGIAKERKFRFKKTRCRFRKWVITHKKNYNFG